MNSSKVSLMFTSPEVEFSNVEINFIRKHLHWKYPAAMGGVIDKTRQLMKALQKHSAPTTKLTYCAARYHPDNDARFVVYENLTSCEENPRFLIGIQPIEKERRKQFFDPAELRPSSTLKVIEKLEAQEKAHDFSATWTANGISGGVVIKLLILYLKSVADEMRARSESWVIPEDIQTPWTFSTELGHHHSQSHYVRLLVDFYRVSPPCSVG